MHAKRNLFLVISLFGAFMNADAIQVIEGKVAMVEPTYLPSSVSFQMTAGITSCPAGTVLRWVNADQSNNRAVYATLLAALTSGKAIQLFINDGDSTCTGVFMHLVN